MSSFSPKDDQAAQPTAPLFPRVYGNNKDCLR